MIEFGANSTDAGDGSTACAASGVGVCLDGVQEVVAGGIAVEVDGY